jgi:hypothetical protein
MKWYKSNCDGDWEHLFGIKINTVDNPGWSIDIDLLDTPLENKQFQKVQVDNGDDDWKVCMVKENIFKGAGDPSKLEEILEIFKEWTES